LFSCGRKRITRRVIARTADMRIFHLDRQAIAAQRAHHLYRLRDDFRTYPVTG
jgi:hypothetical protein